MMIPVTCFADRDVVLFGLGGSGLATARALMAGGARVTAGDDDGASRQRAVAAGINVQDISTLDWSAFNAFVVSPGVPLTHPTPHWSVQKAREAGLEIIGDIELFCRERAKLAPEAPFVAITGTNGKSTTTALIAHILREAGKDAQMGGNIGVPILALEPPAKNRIHVIECSSFQIDLAPSLAPSIGVLLNLTPDHIDRHGTMENYAAIKERLVAGASVAVIGVDDVDCQDILRKLGIAGIPTLAVSSRETTTSHTIYHDDKRLRRRIDLRGGWSLSEILIDLAGARALRGAHNGQNAAAAFGVCEWLEIAHDDIGRAIKTFPGLPHRMEEVGRIGRVLLVNDSKATNADAAEKALLSFDDIFWILGGKAKEGGIESLRPLFCKVRKAYLIGESSDDFAHTLGDDVIHERCGTLDVAIEAAARDAAASQAAEPVALLSPACASYDQFVNFEARGDAFRELARALVARAHKT